MPQNVFEQQEWHGITRRGPGRLDPMSSRTEINTRPGENRLRRIEARKPWTTFQGSPAARLVNMGTHYVLKDKAGTATNFGYSGSAFKACVCFRMPSSAEYMPPSTFLFGATAGRTDPSELGWWFTLATNARIYASFRTGAATSDSLYRTGLSWGSWYWAVLTVGTGSSHNLTIYKDGSLTADSVDSTDARSTYTGTYPLMIGSYEGLATSAMGISIAYAACGTDVPAPWTAAFPCGGTTPTIAFMPNDPRHTVFPAGLNDTTNSYCWVQEPRPEIEKCSITSPFKATGVVSQGGKYYRAQLSDLNLFQDLTVFFFCYKHSSSHVLLRSYDDTFRISTDYMYGDGNGRIAVLWPPENPSLIETTRAGGLRATLSSVDSFVAGTVHWLAVECNPRVETNERQVSIFRWNGSTWADLTVSPTAAYGNGFRAIDMSDAVLCESWTGTTELYDFRIAIGDAGWQTAYTATAISMTTLPTSMAAWLNLDTGGNYVREDRAVTMTLLGDGSTYRRSIAAPDRVDGTYRYRIDPYVGQVSWDGCEYLKNGFLPQFFGTDIDPDGSATYLTDGFGEIEGSKAPVFQALTVADRSIARVGSFSLLTGAAPLHYYGTEPHFLNSPRVTFDVNTSTASTLDFQGGLAWDTVYYFQFTVYDPTTGTESNPYGPYAIKTDTVPGGTTSGYGTPGCSVRFQAVLRTMVNARGLQIRLYRNSSGTGLYHYETSFTLGPAEAMVGGSCWYRFWVTMGVDDESIEGQPSVDFDNTEPPLHSVTAVWGMRAWYVDAINQTRIWYSKLGSYGCVPGTNVIWTDEGTGGAIIGLLPGAGGMLLLREKSIWIIPEFLDESGAYAQVLIPNIGVVSGAAAVWADGVLWWASPTGVYSWDVQNPPVNHSDKLDGLDRSIWDHDPRSTRAYYDRSWNRLTFVCDGSGLVFDLGTGAASLVSAPETSCAQSQTSAYGGPLYGQAGSLFQEVSTANLGLTLSTAGTLCSANAGPTTAGSLTAVYGYWHDGGTAHVGSYAMGWLIPGLATTASDWMTATSQIGRLFTSLSGTYEAVWSKPIESIGVTTTGSSVMMLRTKQSMLDNYLIDRVPVYYRSQDQYLGSLRDTRCYELLDYLTGDLGATSTAYWAFYSFLPAASTAQVASATAALGPNDDGQLAIRQHGNRCYYTFLSYAGANLPDVQSVRMHFTQLRPRGMTDR